MRDRDGVPIRGARGSACKATGHRQPHDARPNDWTGLTAGRLVTHQGFSRRLARYPITGDDETLAARLPEIDIGLKRANARRKRAFGRDFALAMTMADARCARPGRRTTD